MVVTDTVDRHAAVEEVLKNVDLPTRQVMIEARIVVADDNFNRDLGVKLGLSAIGKVDGTQIGVSGSRADSIGIANAGSIVGSTNPVNVNLPRAAVAGSPSLGITLLNAAANTMLSLELLALEADKRGKVVSNPRVVTTNLRPAVILQGSQIPYLSASNAGTETQFKDALLCLLVAPQILNNDAIILNVEVTKDVPDRTVTPPAINVKRVKTQVRVNNGDTAILGGIFEQTLEVGTEKVPFLGDLPVIGNLFKSTSKKDEKTEMLIFLTPRIIDERLSGIR